MKMRVSSSFFCSVFIAFCLLAFMLTASAQQEREPVDFWFAQITDLHQSNAEANKRIEAAVAEINKTPMKLAFVAVTGDLTADKTADTSVTGKLAASLQKLDVPYWVVPGNHDIDRKDPAASIKQLEAVFGPTHGKAEHRGVVMLFVNTDPLARGYKVEGYDPMQWLKDELDVAGEKPVIIFHHEPSVEDFYNNKTHRGWHPDRQAEWQKLLNAHNVKAVIAGHFHRDEQHWLGDVPLYLAPPVVGYWGRQGSYRLYHYREGKLSYTTQYLR